MVLITNLMDSAVLDDPFTNRMVKFSTKLSFDVRLESKRVRETVRIISKVLKVSKETIRTKGHLPSGVTFFCSHLIPQHSPLRKEKTLHSFDERPDGAAEEVVGDTDQPGLGPVQVRVGCLFAGDAQCMECVVRRPFAFQRFDGPVPNLAVGVLLAHGEEFTLEILLRDVEGGFEMDVRWGDRVVGALGDIPGCGGIPG